MALPEEGHFGLFTLFELFPRDFFELQKILGILTSYTRSTKKTPLNSDHYKARKNYFILYNLLFSFNVSWCCGHNCPKHTIGGKVSSEGFQQHFPPVPWCCPSTLVRCMTVGWDVGMLGCHDNDHDKDLKVPTCEMTKMPLHSL
jgi:hypothetical protein